MSTEAEMNTTALPSEVTKVLLSLSWIDYSLFILMFVLSGVIGIYYGCFGNKQATTKDYLHGGKTMKIFPVAMSLMASNLSGISLLGIPAEIYIYGSQYSMCMISAVLMVMVVSQLYLPVFYKLQLNSTYEYFKLRFNNKIRIIASALYVLSSFLYIPIVIYVPALAFNQVTGIDLYIITPIVSVVCIFYTTLGGLKAVVWTDTLQFSVTLLTLGFVLIMGTISVGGFGAVWEKSGAGQRLEFFNMDLDPTLRQTFWSVVIGHVFSWMSFVGCSPATVQRFMAVPSLNSAKNSLIILATGIIITKAICCFSGLIMYAKYSDCDPFTTGGIRRSDQMLPYYVLDVASEIPGISGLFVAGVFSTALSTLSTHLNSLAGVVYTDFIAPFMPKHIAESTSSNIMKGLVVFMGFVCVTLVFLAEKLGSVLEMSISLGAVTGGPLLGLFTLGMVFPMANEKGAMVGGLTSLAFISWIVVKTKMHNLNGLLLHVPKPLSVHGCGPEFNITSLLNSAITTTTALPPTCQEDEPFWMFKFSFYYYTLIGSVVAVIVGLLVSWVTRNESDAPVDPDLLCPLAQRLLLKSAETTKYASVENALHFISMSEKEKEIEALESANRLKI